MILFDTLLRGGTMWIMATVALMLLLKRQTRKQGIIVLIAALCFAGMLIKTGLMAPQISPTLHPYLIAGAIVFPLPLTWLIVELFVDTKREGRSLIGLGVLVVSACVVSMLYPSFAIVRPIAELVLFGAIFYVAFSSAHGDLVEDRCRFRPVFLSAIALVGISIATTNLMSIDLSPGFVVIQALVFLIITIEFAFLTLSPMINIWPQPQETAPLAYRQTSTGQTQLRDRLIAAMDDGIWREEGLTIRTLAEHLNTNEHRLRALINNELKFRNFSNFINSHRIQAAQQALADRTDATILEIAYDSGFASLAPFNKAFRAQTGLTPTQYRQNLQIS